MICLSFLSVLNSVVLFLWYTNDVSDGDICPKDDCVLLSTTCICMACVIRNRNSQTFHAKIATTDSENRFRENKDMKIIARVLDKIFCITMIILPLSVTVVITVLILK